MWCRQHRGKRHTAGLVRRHANTNDPIRMTGKHLTPVRHVPHFERRQRERPIQVQLPAIIVRVIARGEREQHITEWLIGSLSEGPRHEVLHGQFLGFLLFAVKQELPKLWKVVDCTGMRIGTRLTRPERVVVKLNTFLTNPTKDDYSFEISEA